MKKHLGLLLLLITQNACAMVDPFGMMLKYDEKCKLVAKYLYNYPAGRNKEEAHSIKRFWDGARSFHHQPNDNFLLQSCNRYKNILQNIEAEKMLHDMHVEDLPFDIKHKIFSYALWSYAEQSYAFYNSCQFTAMSHALIPPYLWSWPSKYYMPCFLAEIQECDDQYIFFSKTELAKDSTISEHNHSRIYSDMFHNDDAFGECNNRTKIKLFCCTKTTCNGNTLLCMPIECEMCQLEAFVRFLEKKDLRVTALKKTFNESIKNLACMDGKEAIDEFIHLLTFYKESPKTIAFMYKAALPLSIHTMLDNLPSMHERETNRKSIKKSAISGL